MLFFFFCCFFLLLGVVCIILFRQLRKSSSGIQLGIVASLDRTEVDTLTQYDYVGVVTFVPIEVYSEELVPATEENRGSLRSWSRRALAIAVTTQ